MIATATISRWDARLSDEALDWCVANSRFVSAVSLRNSLKAGPADVRDGFSDFSASVKRHVRVPWPGGGTAYPFAPTGRRLAPDLARPAILQLRLRAIDQFRHRLARAARLAKLVEPLPLRIPDWQFRVIHAVVVFAETAPPTGMPRAVEARRTIRTLGPDLRGLGIIGSVPTTDGEALAGEFERWSLEVLGDWASDRNASNEA